MPKDEKFKGAKTQAGASAELNKNISFGKLYELNNDIVGWLLIEGTGVNYPVMYTPDKPDYYLYKNFDKDYSRSGVPFMDVKSSLEPQSDNILIHGHHMKDGSMFKDLVKYKDRDFFNENRDIFLDRDGDIEHYERIRAIATHRGCGTHNLNGGGIML